MKHRNWLLLGLLAMVGAPRTLPAQERQHVEGFASVVFSHGSGNIRQSRDFRGHTRGYPTAGWWADGQMENNIVVWKTAVCPQKKPATFVFVAASSGTPSEFSRGPKARLYVNDRPALTFDLGVTRDRVWTEGYYELAYESKRVEWPYWGSPRLFETSGNSGLYRLSVPASDITAGEAVTLKVEMLPFPAWRNGWFMVKEYRDASVENEHTLAEQVGQLQSDVRRLSELTHVLASQLYSELVDTRDFDHFIIHTDGFRHFHPADLIPLKNGDLLITTRDGTEHISRDGDVITLRSRDGGKTWGERQVIAGIENFDEREACGVQLKDGTIVVGIFYNDLYLPDGSYNWEWRSELQFTGEKRYLGTYVITSNDDGKTWSKPNYIDTKGMPFTDIEGPADAPIEMPDGSILMALMAYNVRGDMENQASVLLKSTDKGKTWQYFSTMADDPGGKLGHFQEPALLRTRSGRLITAIRNTGPDNAIWTTYSDDDGKTWKPVEKSPMIGHPADLIELADGRILCTYGIRSGRHADPAGIRASFSDDQGETWRVDQEVQIRKDFVNFDIGYPESIQTPDGRVLTVYYFNLFGKFFLGGTFWKP